MTLDEAAPLLQAALDRALSTHTMADVAAMIASGHAKLFTGGQSVLVAVIEDHPTHDALCIWLAGGDLGELVDDLRPQAEAWAKGLGASKSTIVGRRGWARSLAPHDYRAAATVFVKDL